MINDVKMCRSLLLGIVSCCAYLYLYRRVCVCVCVSVCVSFQAYTRRRLWSDRNQIWHTHADSHSKGCGQNKHLPRVT